MDYTWQLGLCRAENGGEYQIIYACLHYSCPDAEKVKVVQVVGRNINKLSIQLVESADIMAEVMEERGEPDQDVQEDTELLRRDWSSQVSKGGGGEVPFHMS